MNASEDALDLHYWQKCPFLMACSRCTQVIEISTLPEHLLTECSEKADYQPCPKCSMVSGGRQRSAQSAALAICPPPSLTH